MAQLSIRAPKQNESWFVRPEAARVADLLEDNLRRLDRSDSIEFIDGQSLQDLRLEARAEVVALAAKYSSEAIVPARRLDLHDFSSESRVIMSGHQPELFHPGVWFKNFLLSQFSQCHSALGINVVIDHDLAKRTQLAVPAKNDSNQFTRQSFELANLSPRTPWEFSQLEELITFEQAVAEVLDKLDTLQLHGSWLAQTADDIKELLQSGRSLGEAFAISRYRTEHSIGLTHLEVPFSRLATLNAWRVFVGCLLSRANEVHEVYNDVRANYRRDHGIHNEAQPFPALGTHGDWLETPFWIYSSTTPVRKPLWVRREPDRLILSDGSFAKEIGEFSTRELSCRESIHHAFQGLSWQIRPRALTTTLFMRLFLSDLFIHGIGGAVYDALTDQMMRRLWPISAPNYLVATATVMLPLGKPNAMPLSSYELERRLRDWRWTPERCFNEFTLSDGRLQGIMDAKKEWVNNKPRDGSVRAWHQQLQQLNEKIRQQKPDFEKQLLSDLAIARDQESENRIFSSREYSFAIFPVEYLCSSLTELAQQAIGLRATSGN